MIHTYLPFLLQLMPHSSLALQSMLSKMPSSVSNPPACPLQGLMSTDLRQITTDSTLTFERLTFGQMQPKNTLVGASTDAGQDSLR
jgi:hypothetical protein